MQSDLFEELPRCPVLGGQQDELCSRIETFRTRSGVQLFNYQGFSCYIGGLSSEVTDTLANTAMTCSPPFCDRSGGDREVRWSRNMLRNCRWTAGGSGAAVHRRTGS